MTDFVQAILGLRECLLTSVNHQQAGSYKNAWACTGLRTATRQVALRLQATRASA